MFGLLSNGVALVATAKGVMTGLAVGGAIVAASGAARLACKGFGKCVCACCHRSGGGVGQCRGGEHGHVRATSRPAAGKEE